MVVQRLRVFTAFLILLSMAACAAPQPTPTQPALVSDESLGTPSPAPLAETPTESLSQPSGEGETSGEEGVGGGGEPSPTPPSNGGQPPLASTWPLESDLFYLNSAGQVWRQPLLGDESAAAAVTELDRTVLDFSVAPGGEWLLYRTSEFIGVREVQSLNGQIIADAGQLPPTAWPGHTMAWSADASKLSYTNADGFEVYIPGVGADFGPAVVPITERLIRDMGWSFGAEYLLIWRDDASAALYQSSNDVVTKWVELGTINGYKWLEDGRLAFAPVEGGLAVLNPSDLNSRVFVVPQDRHVSLIGQRVDGAIVFFVHTNSTDEVGYLHSANPADLSFRQESGVAVDTRRRAWTPGAVRVISPNLNDSASSTVTLLDPVTGGTASLEASGQPLSFDWGSIPPRGVAGMPIPTELYFRAPQAGIVQVWRMPTNGDEPLPITNTATDVLDYDISPDGTQITFTSGGVIQRQTIGAADNTQIATLPADTRNSSGFPAFSPDGGRIAYSNGGIWVTQLATNQQTRLVADNIPTDPNRENEIVIYSNPQWSPDGQWILATAGYYEGYDFVLISVAGTPREPIPLNIYIADAAWTDDNRVMVFSSGGFYNEPALTLISPASPPLATRLTDLPVVEAVQRESGEIAFLRVPSPIALGPTSVTLYSIPLAGGSPLAESPAVVIAFPQLSPDGLMIAGLVQVRSGEFGGFSGRLAIANPKTGEIFVIEGLNGVTDIEWQ